MPQPPASLDLANVVGLRETKRWGHDPSETQLLEAFHGERAVVDETATSMAAAALYATTGGLGSTAP
eukprot:4911645-Lingulodinium_polyedra.AAC.1